MGTHPIFESDFDCLTEKMDDQDDYILWAGNLEDKVTEELLYELFLQAGPLDYVKKPKEKNFAFICFKHKESVKYAMKLFEGLNLFGKLPYLKFRESKSDTPRSNESERSGEVPSRLDSGRRRSRSRSPNRNRNNGRNQGWDDESPRSRNSRDNGRKVYMGNDPYRSGGGGWNGNGGYGNGNGGYNDFREPKPYQPSHGYHTPDNRQGRRHQRFTDDNQRSYSAPQNRYNQNRNRRY